VNVDELEMETAFEIVGPDIHQKFNPDEKFQLATFELLTGKKHQIRLASAYAFGCPILGDFKYGYKDSLTDTLFRRKLKYTKS